MAVPIKGHSETGECMVYYGDHEMKLKINHYITHSHLEFCSPKPCQDMLASWLKWSKTPTSARSGPKLVRSWGWRWRWRARGWPASTKDKSQFWSRVCGSNPRDPWLRGPWGGARTGSVLGATPKFSSMYCRSFSLMDGCWAGHSETPNRIQMPTIMPRAPVT